MQNDVLFNNLQKLTKKVVATRRVSNKSRIRKTAFSITITGTYLAFFGSLI